VGTRFFRPSRPALGPTQPPVKWVPGLSRGVKCGRGVLLTTHPLLLPRSWRVELYLYPPSGPHRDCNGVLLPLLPITQGAFVFIKLGMKNCAIPWFGIDTPSQTTHRTNFIMVTISYVHNHFIWKNYEASTACFTFMTTWNRSINKESLCTSVSAIREHQSKTQECRQHTLNIYLRPIWPAINPAQPLQDLLKRFLVQSQPGYWDVSGPISVQRDVPGSITTRTLGVLADHGATQPLHEKAETIPQRRHRFQ